MDPRPPSQPSPSHRPAPAHPLAAPGEAGRRTAAGAKHPARRLGGSRRSGSGAARSRVRAGPWLPRRRLLPLALLPFGVFAALALLAAYSLGAAGCGGPRPARLLLDAGRPAGSPPGSNGPAVLVESPRFALPPSRAGNRFDSGWERRSVGGRPVLVPAGSGSASRLQLVNLGEEVQRTLTLDLVREGLPEGARLSVRTGERELARATIHGAALPLRVRLPEDLPVGEVPLDLAFASAEGGAAGQPAETASAAAAPRAKAETRAPVASPPVARPALYGAALSPVLPPGSARVEGQDVALSGNCLVYLRCQLAGNEALVGTFVPPAAARAGQRFELSVERPDGTPIRRFHWQPSFWNRLRGARRFELPLRGARGPALVRLISRAGDAGGPPGRWRALGLVNVTGEILTPGQGQ